MSIRFDWGNSVNDFIKSTEDFSKDVDKEVDKLIKITVEEILRDVKRMTPSETGRLRNAWKRHKKNGKNYDIQNDTEYASYVENGSRHNVPVRMLMKAFENGKIRLKRRLDALGRKMKREF